MDDWERQLLGAVEELKEWEKASRPPPEPPRNYEYKANFKGIVTLKTAEMVRLPKYSFCLGNV
jgi:hypothetical protein